MIVQPQDFREILFNEMHTDDDELTTILEAALDEEHVQEQIKTGYSVYFSACPDDDTVAVFSIRNHPTAQIILEDPDTYYTSATEYVKAYLAH